MGSVVTVWLRVSGAESAVQRDWPSLCLEISQSKVNKQCRRCHASGSQVIGSVEGRFITDSSSSRPSRRDQLSPKHEGKPLVRSRGNGPGHPYTRRAATDREMKLRPRAVVVKRRQYSTSYWGIPSDRHAISPGRYYGSSRRADAPGASPAV